MAPGRTAGLGRAKTLAWVRYHPRDMLVAVASVSGTAELAHRRMADVVWAGGEWPANQPESLARLVRQDTPALPKLLEELFSLGWRLDGEYLHHDAIAQLRREAVRYLKSKTENAKASAHRRWVRNRSQDKDLEANEARTERERSESEAKAKSCLTTTQQQQQHSGNTDERLTLSGSARKKSAGEAEKAFLADVHAVLETWRKGSSTLELQNWGGWWRTSFRKNARKARAVLNDVGALAKEGRITTSPGAAAVDLWKRLP